MEDREQRRKSPGEIVANAAVAGYNKGTQKKGEKGKKGKKGAAGKGMAAAKGAAGGNPWSILTHLPKLHHGGKVRKTGAYRLLKGETVVPAKKGKSSRRKASHKRVQVKA